MIVEGSIRLQFTYAAGSVASRFLAALRDGKAILASRCARCRLVVCPPRPSCPACGSAQTDLVEVGPAGTVEAWTEMPGRGVFGLIRIDGAAGGLVHRLLPPAAEWAFGARVQPRFAADRVGSINDIEGFEPERGAP